MRVTDYEIVSHGYWQAQYFPGCGVARTRFQHCATGAGMDAVEAYNEALEQIACSDADDTSALPDRPRGQRITKRHRVPSDLRGEDSEVYWYVSIRYNLGE